MNANDKSFTDKYGKAVALGTFVAFNYSGKVCLGRIVKITSRLQRRFDPVPYNFLISHIDDPRSISKVGNIENLVVTTPND
jgi:hypothetical protein